MAMAIALIAMVARFAMFFGGMGGRGRGGDPSGQPEVFANIRSQEDVAGSVIEKMLVDNPARFYGI